MLRLFSLMSDTMIALLIVAATKLNTADCQTKLLEV